MQNEDQQLLIRQAFEEHAALTLSLESIRAEVSQFADIVSQCLIEKGTILLCGNGGSAADAQHLAGELVSRFYLERRAFSAIALHTNSTVMTAIANDYSFDVVYSRQVEALGKPKDVLVAISTSGNSQNVLNAAKAARDLGMVVVGLTGSGGGKLMSMCDLCICIPSAVTPRVQEMHILIGHVVCQIAEVRAAVNA